MTATDDQLLIEAQRIVQKVDTEDTSLTGPDISWFRDLIMLYRHPDNTTQEEVYQASGNAIWTAQIKRMQAAKSAHPDLGTIGCEKEKILMKYVKSKQASGEMPTDSELQIQACKVIEDVEPKSDFKCKEAVQWFKFLINSSTNWLSEFKRRADLLPSLEKDHEHIQVVDDEIMNDGVYHLSGLQQGSRGAIKIQHALSKAILGEEIQFESHISMHGEKNSGNQTILENLSALSTSESNNSLPTSHEDALVATPATGDLTSAKELNDAKTSITFSPQALHWGLPDKTIGCALPMNTNDYSPTPFVETPLYASSRNQSLRYFLSDVNCYGRLEKELTRYVTSCLSPNNPLQHVCFQPHCF